MKRGRKPNSEIYRRASKIVTNLSGIPDGDKLWILYTAINIVVDGKFRGKADQSVNVNFQPRGPRPMIDCDKELRDYLHMIREHMTIEEIRNELLKQFGQKRTPSAETIRRYLRQWVQSVV